MSRLRAAKRDAIFVLALLSVGLCAASCSDDGDGDGARDNISLLRDAADDPDAGDMGARDTSTTTEDGALVDTSPADDTGFDSALDDSALDGGGGGGCGDAHCDPTESCTSCPQDCGACAPVAPVFVDAPLPGTVQNNLSCHVPGIQAIESKVEVSLQGADVSSVVGVDDNFAGIGAKFDLRNNQHPNDWVNVLEPRSGAGAGWQTSFLVTDWSGGAGIIVFNQAAGNAVGYQWGYGSTILTDGQNLHATTWNPLDSDHIHATSSVHSPCEPSGYVFDDGAVDIAGSLVQTAHGNAMAWRNRYRFRSHGNQHWPSWSAEQAFYLSRPVARAQNLRLYLVRGSTHHGPFAIYDPFTIPDAACDNSFCNTGAYDYAVLVWTIKGLDIGVALPDLSRGTSINLEQTTYCTNPSDDSCGNINFHSWLASGGPVSYTTGQVRTLSQVYYVGTLPQLADLGFAIW